MNKKLKAIVLVASLALSITVWAAPQTRTTGYFDFWMYSNSVYTTDSEIKDDSENLAYINPTWMQNTNTFWYKVKTSSNGDATNVKRHVGEEKFTIPYISGENIAGNSFKLNIEHAASGAAGIQGRWTP